MSDGTPPRWAERLLEWLLDSEDRQTVPGDLLEEYRLHVLPARGEAAADAWYIRQVAGFQLRATWPWALAFSAAYIARVVMDCLAPPADFHARAAVSTTIAIALLLGVGSRASWRTGSVAGGTLAAATTAVLASIVSVASVGVMLSIRHDPSTLDALARSGGVDEAFALPVLLVVPATIIGVLGGVAAAGARWLAARLSPR